MVYYFWTGKPSNHKHKTSYILRDKKSEKHRGILGINKTKNESVFSFCIILPRTAKDVYKLDDTKTSQPIDIPIRIIEQNIDIVTNFSCHGSKNLLNSPRIFSLKWN